MKIATWNVNSVRARLERLLAGLQRSQPDILCGAYSGGILTVDRACHHRNREKCAEHNPRLVLAQYALAVDVWLVSGGPT
jgi:hypothetical protein